VNLILNWEMSQASWFRYLEDKAMVPGHPLVPGRFAEIAVRQTAPDRVAVSVDERTLWSSPGRLFGTVTIYPMSSSIGVTDVRVLGIPDPDRKVTAPSHRRW
jgi:hypothetical protein